MGPGNLTVMGASLMVMAVAVLMMPLVNILAGWWLAPLLFISGVLTLLYVIALEIWHGLRGTARFGICCIYREERKGRPATHHWVLNQKIWKLLGGGHCRLPFSRRAA